MSVAPDVNPTTHWEEQHDPQRFRTLRPSPHRDLPARGFQRPRPASSRQGAPRPEPPAERHLFAASDRDREGLPQPGVDQADAVAITPQPDTTTAASPKARRRVSQSDAFYSSAATMTDGAVSAPDAMASASSA